jgi:hypothetical protein
MPKRQVKDIASSKRLMVSLRSGQREKLQELAHKSGISESQTIRLIVDEFLERHAGKEMRFKLSVKDPAE